MAKKLIFLSMVALGLTGCGVTLPGGITLPDAGNESEPAPMPTVTINSCSDLVPIRARNTAEGIVSENKWLERNYPGAERIGATVSDCGSKPVDKITFIHDNKRKIVLFDISSFFGKVQGDDLDDLLDG